MCGITNKHVKYRKLPLTLSESSDYINKDNTIRIKLFLFLISIIFLQSEWLKKWQVGEITFLIIATKIQEIFNGKYCFLEKG